MNRTCDHNVLSIAAGNMNASSYFNNSITFKCSCFRLLLTMYIVVTSSAYKNYLSIHNVVYSNKFHFIFILDACSLFYRLYIVVDLSIIIY